MRNKIYGFFLFLFYVLIIFYVVMFVITYIEEKNVDDEVTPTETTTVVEDENYDTEGDNAEITDRTSPREIVNEYDDDVKGFFGRLFDKIKKFFTSDRDGRNLFEITNENILNLFRKDKGKEEPINNEPSSLNPDVENTNGETEYQTE